jgi:hypothetical protein
MNLGKSIQRFYFFKTLILVGLMGYGVYYLMQNNFFSSEEINEVFESNYLIQKYQKVSPVAQIKKFVDQDRISDAANSLNELESSVSQFSSLENNSKTGLSATIKKQKDVLNKLLGYPSISSITSVFSNKIASFNSFVSTNGWRTLTRVSKRVRARFSHSSLRSGNYYDYSKFNKTYYATVKDIKLMEKVTMNSVLSSRDKQSIMVKLRNLSTEMNMLNKYLADLGKFDSNHKSLNIKFNNWLKKVSPEIIAKKNSHDEMSKNIALYIAGIFSFILLGLLFGFVTYRTTTRKMIKEVESTIVDQIQERIIPTVDTVDEKFFSPEYEEKLLKFREYIHKRISLGSIFQETTPFGTLLLDSNLNLVWANDLVYETWGLTEKRINDLITWDYLQMFTNLGEDDPIQMALNQAIAGIYQIQIKGADKEDCLPFEMYVSPVEYANQKRIMIFLYPLRSLEESLANQTKSIIGPVSRTIEALTQGTFKKEKKEALSSDYEVAGISEVFHKFESFNELIIQQRYSLLSEIEDLENKLFDKLKVIDDISHQLKEITIKNDTAQSAIKNTKTTVVHNIDLRYEVESDFEDLMKISKFLTKENDQLIKHSEKAQGLIDENARAFTGVSEVKDRLKKLKSNLADYRQRLGQSVDQTMIFTKMDSTSRLDHKKLVDSLTKIKLEMKGFETALLEFSKVGQDLDVGLAKLSMTFEGKEAPDVSEYRKRLKGIIKKVDELNFSLENNSRSGEKSDNLLVSSISNLYHAVSGENKIIEGISGLIAGSRDDYSNNSETQSFSESSNV